MVGCKSGAEITVDQFVQKIANAYATVVEKEVPFQKLP